MNHLPWKVHCEDHRLQCTRRDRGRILEPARSVKVIWVNFLPYVKLANQSRHIGRGGINCSANSFCAYPCLLLPEFLLTSFAFPPAAIHALLWILPHQRVREQLVTILHVIMLGSRRWLLSQSSTIPVQVFGHRPIFWRNDQKGRSRKIHSKPIHTQ